MICPKQDISGTWQCGRPAGHRGAHLSLEAFEAVKALLVKFEALQAKSATAKRRKRIALLKGVMNR